MVLQVIQVTGRCGARQEFSDKYSRVNALAQQAFDGYRFILERAQR